MGDTGDGSYSTLYGYAWAAILDRAQRRMRLFQAQVPAEGPWPLSDPRGPEVAVWVEVEIPPLPHPVEEVQHLALAFDQAARHVVAYERQGQVWVRQWDPITQTFIMRGPWPGHDPVLINDAVVGYYPPDSDVLLFHLSPDRRSLIMRVQRELYATAGVIQTFDQPVVLDQAVALPYQLELLGSTEGSLDTTGYVVRSQVYPVYSQDVLGGVALTPPLAGDYIPIVIILDMSTDGLGSAALAQPTSGEFVSIVVILDMPTDGLGSAALAQPTSGEFVSIVIILDMPTDNLSTTLSAPVNASYYLAVIVVDLTGTGYISPEVISEVTLQTPSTGAYERA
ncbi:MAG: hypothetical protein NZ821_07665 [Gloeomargarita sp. SKYB31]|nr:hypothetical protein [Gloeomargarita sp. SKYB31]